MRRAFTVTPILVGSGVGLVDGIINPAGGAAPVKHAKLIFDVVALGAGLAGAYLKWNPNLAYGLQCGSAALLFSRLPAAVQSRSLDAFGALVPGGRGGAADSGLSALPLAASAPASSGCGCGASA